MNAVASAVKYGPRTGYPFEWREVALPHSGFGPVLTELRPYYVDPLTGRETEGAWVPQYGSQLAFMTAHTVFEVLYEGTRGPGKTDCLLMDFLQHVGKGWGAEWRGVLFRQTYKQLVDVINKSKKWFPRMCPGAKFNATEHVWTFPDGEQLLLRYMRRPEDYENYHGHAYPWIGWEELTNWPDDRCYRLMMSCSRSSKPGMPRCYRATTNPYGPGHNWVKSRFRLPQARGRIILDSMRDGEREPPRVAIHGSIYENKILLHADPDYIQKIRAAARNPSELKAWLEGSWDIVAGGMFDDIWRGEVHIVPAVPSYVIPKTWKIDRSFDWGSSKPFAVCWWAESSGEPFTYNGRVYGKVRGDLYMIQEWYGWRQGARNEGLRMLATDVAAGIKDREEDWELKGRVKPGPADSSIFDEENGNNIAKDMAKAPNNITWLPADKGPGSRKQGWEQIRKMLKGALPPMKGVREAPGLFICDNCLQAQETFPNLSRDDDDLDDVNTEDEDHIGDAVRYRVRKKLRGVSSSKR